MRRRDRKRARETRTQRAIRALSLSLTLCLYLSRSLSLSLCSRPSLISFPLPPSLSLPVFPSFVPLSHFLLSFLHPPPLSGEAPRTESGRWRAWRRTYYSKKNLINNKSFLLSQGGGRGRGAGGRGGVRGAGGAAGAGLLARQRVGRPALL